MGRVPTLFAMNSVVWVLRVCYWLEDAFWVVTHVLGVPKFSVCVICVSVLARTFYSWLGSLWLIWSLETHLLTIYLNLCLVGPNSSLWCFLLRFECKFWIVP